MYLSKDIAQTLSAAILLLGTLAATPAFSQQPATNLSVDFKTSTTSGSGSAATVSFGARGSGVPRAVTFGGRATYSVTVTNVGASRAFAVSVEGEITPTGDIIQVFPDGGIGPLDGGTGPTICGPPVTLQCPAAAQPGAGCQVTPYTFKCNVGDLIDGQLADGGLLAGTTATRTFTVFLPVPPKPYPTPCPSGLPLLQGAVAAKADNSDVVDAGMFLPDAGPAITATNPFADLAVTLTGPNGEKELTAKEGDTVTYNVTARNLGSCRADRVFLENGNAAATITWQSNSGVCPSGFPPPGPPPGPLGGCQLVSSNSPDGGTFEPGDSVSFTSTYRVEKLPESVAHSGDPNVINITSRDFKNMSGVVTIPGTPDPDTSNNAASVKTQVTGSGGCSSADVGGLSIGLVGLVLLAFAIKRRRGA